MSETRLFEILTGLPPYGPMAEQFSDSSLGMYQEGLVVCFYPKEQKSWVGNFQLGRTCYSEVLPHPNQQDIIIIAGGKAYVINPNTRFQVDTFDCYITETLIVQDKNVILFVTESDLLCFGNTGLLWRSRSLGFDGLRITKLDWPLLHGEAWDIDDKWYPFILNVETGLKKG